MKKHIALVAMLVSGTSAMAADTEFKWDAESRTRFFANTNYDRSGAGFPGGAALTAVSDSSDSVFRQRTSLGLNLKKGDNLSGRIRLLHSMQMGGLTVAGENPAQPSASNANHLAYVQEAWVAWNFAENLTAKWGRMSMMTVADGTVVASNDWFQNPYASDSVAIIGDYSFGRVGLMGVKAADTAVPAAPNSADPETVFYGLSFDVKNLPDFLKGLNIHAIQQNTDQTAAAGLALTRYGLTVNGDMMGIDYRLTYAMHNGKTTAATAADRKGTMLDATVGYTLADVKNLRFGVTYHMDSGADNDATNGSETYQPFYYERHASAGRMDILGWGNMTYADIQITADVMENGTLGLNYLMFSRTSDKDAIYKEGVGAAGGAAIGGGSTITEKAVATEIDLYFTHKYDNGLELTARYGMFTVGEYLKKSTTGIKDGVTQGMLEARVTF